MNDGGSHARRAVHFAAGLCAAAVASASFGVVREVDGRGGTPFTTIQSAIDASAPGEDEVFVHCGTYRENVVLRSNVPVRGQGAGCTVIDGGAAGVVVRLEFAGPQTVLEGFTITNGSGSGIRVYGGAPVITGNVVVGNGNPPYGPPYILGGGIYVVGGGGSGADPMPTITRNIVRENAAYDGGGVFAAQRVRITSNVIADNLAVFGGGIEAANGPMTIANNTILSNIADYGGGIWGDAFEADLANNVLTGNLAYGTAGDIALVGDRDVTFVSNDSWGNMPYEAYPAGLPGPGNISEDPEIPHDADNDFRGWQPRSSSPLIDAASPTHAPGADLRGISQPVDGDADGAPRWDIGARENEGLTRLRHDGVGFFWDRGVHLPEDYNVYRGDLGVLRSTGIYTQEPATVPGARHFCGIGPGLVDGDAPEADHAFFYLAVARGSVEGTLGFDSRGTERPLTLSCQGF